MRERQTVFQPVSPACYRCCQQRCTSQSVCPPVALEPTVVWARGVAWYPLEPSTSSGIAAPAKGSRPALGLTSRVSLPRTDRPAARYTKRASPKRYVLAASGHDASAL